MKLLIATTNQGKLRELSAMLSDVPGLEIMSPSDVAPLPDVVEDGATFADNAAIKARAFLKATGHAVLADDSGLEVDALAGRPGVHSARYAGEDASDGDNVDKLLLELEGVPVAKRTARYRACLIIALLDGSELMADGSCEGHILQSRRGTGGFGYDPVFQPDSHGLSMAELPKRTKNQISHRGRACAEMVLTLTNHLASQQA